MSTEIFELCAQVEQNIKDVHRVFTQYHDIASTLENFWSLQDSVARLVEAAVDYPAETFEIVSRAYPTLIENIVELLERARDFPSVDGVRSSCKAINEALHLLEYLKHAPRSAEAEAEAINSAAIHFPQPGPERERAERARSAGATS